MNPLDSILTCVTILGVVGILIFGMGSCGKQQADTASAHRALRETCIQQGGSVIDTNNGYGFHCIQSGKTVSH